MASLHAALGCAESNGLAMLSTSDTSAQAQPLSGLIVLDLGQIYQGPYCGFLLAMAGATVVKIEPPQGEPIRARRQSAYPLAMLNTNKLGVSLDLKNSDCRQRFLEMVDRADVVLENFAPGVMTRLGLGSADMLLRNPRLVYASATGYGSWGPDRDRLAMDLTVQAMSGAMSVTGYPDRPPVKAGPAVCDFLGGTHLYGAIMTALYERTRTGKGRVVEVAMHDAIIPAMASNLQLFFENPERQPRVGNRHGALSMAPYNGYVALDGFVTIMCVTELHWRALCRRWDAQIWSKRRAGPAMKSVVSILMQPMLWWKPGHPHSLEKKSLRQRRSGIFLAHRYAAFPR